MQQHQHIFETICDGLPHIHHLPTDERLLPWCSLETSHCQFVREKPECTCQCVATVQSGNKPMSVSPSETSLCGHVSVLSLCSLDTSHCEPVHQRAACVFLYGTCQCVGAVQSGNKPLSVSSSESSLCRHISLLSRCSLETSHCEPVHQRAAYMCMSVCCHGAVWKQATFSQSVREQPV